MNIDVITLFPEMFSALNYGIPAIARDKGLLDCRCHNPRDYTTDKHKTVDDRPFGGGPGMVMKVEPIRKCLAHIKDMNPGKVVYLSPQGRTVDDAFLRQEALQSDIILICGRYEGIDERIISEDVDEEWSIGDFVLSGGELAAMAIIDAIARLIPGALGHDQSADMDSFCTGWLDHPHFTRPESIDGQEVPKVLLSGDHEAIKKWRKMQSIGKTWLKKPALFNKIALSREENELLTEFQKSFSGEKS